MEMGTARWKGMMSGRRKEDVGWWMKEREKGRRKEKDRIRI